LVRGELTKLARGVLCALITIDVHARDIVSELVSNKVSGFLRLSLLSLLFLLFYYYLLLL